MTWPLVIVAMLAVAALASGVAAIIESCKPFVAHPDTARIARPLNTNPSIIVERRK